MDSIRVIGSDSNECTYGADFLKLAREVDIPEDLLRSALDDAAEVMRDWPPRIRPANKKALRGVARSLAKAIEQLSKTGVRERLAAAVSEKRKDPDDYFVWVAAEHRVDQALKGARDLLEIVKRGETTNFRSGRPQYDLWQLAIKLLLGYWIEDLGRKVTISGHLDDPCVVNSSDTVRFVYRSMRLIGEEKITVQACRRILQNLKKEGNNFGFDINEF